MRIYIIKTLKSYLTNLVNYVQQDWRSLFLWTMLVLFAVFFTNVFLIQSFRVVSGSMIPTLYEDDVLFVSKWSYGYSRNSFPHWLSVWLPNMERFLVFTKPQHGDVIIFTDEDRSNVYVKRIIGIPGDKIQIVGGQVMINNRTLLQEAYSEQLTKKLDQQGTTLPRMDLLPKQITVNDIRLESILTDVQYYILDQKSTFLDYFGPVELPENHYFVMGDNRDNSLDSRIEAPKGLGFIDFRQIVGKVLWLRRSLWSNTWRSVTINSGQ